MDNASTQAQITERQELCFAILNVIYESEFPITIDTIAYKLQRPITSRFAALLTRLVGTGHVRAQVIEGSLNYSKPARPFKSHLPLPYYIFDLYPED